MATLIFLSVAASVSAQAPVANFSGNNLSGCAPLLVSFTDLSSGSPVAWNWDLGNGQLSTAQNPVVSYSQPGVYAVRLVARNANGIDEETKTAYITVYASPIAGLSANITTACVPATIQFTDMSITPPDAGNIISWSWDFGDGTTSTLQHPSHVYNNVGFYTVYLTVTSNTGCTGTIGASRYIRVVNGIDANFDFTQSATCGAPYGISFMDQSSGPGNFSYTWDFGNGTPASNLQNPSTVYTASGTYPVTLTVQSSLGCGGSIQKNIVLSANTTDFSAPVSTCIANPVSFTNTSSPAPVSSSWDFGDGTTSAQINPVKTYLTSGTFMVKLVNDYGNCRDSITKTITIIDQPVVDFSADDSSSCSAPFTVQFTDLSPSASYWLWDFGDGSTSILQNPSHTYTSYGSYSVTLTIAITGDCANRVIKNNFIRVAAPTVRISNAPAGGCIPYTFNPVASVQAVDNIVSYLWDMGEPGAIYTTPSPSHTYSTSGSYVIQLTVTTEGGCTATTSSTVNTGTLPTVDFSFIPATTCSSDSVRFTAIAGTTPGALVTWQWNFDDGQSSALQNPTHLYKDTGVFNVTLLVSNGGCANTATHAVRVLPPVANFGYLITDCNNPTIVTFSDSSLVDPVYGPIQYQWIPDNITGTVFPFTSPALPPPYNYGSLGTYSSTLIVTNGACSDTIVKPVVLLNLSPVFAASKSLVCKNETFTLSEISTDPSFIKDYEWTIYGRTFHGQSVSLSIAATGTYDVTLVTTDINNCIKTKNVTGFITVIGPKADFVLSGPGACIASPFVFTDQSTPAGSITNWAWDFGDGIQGAFTAAPFTHSYTNEGSYTVSLTVKDSNGCTDVFTTTSSVLITNPEADFKADTIYCPLAPLQFTDLSSGNSLTYAWSFGDGGGDANRNPLHAYPAGDNVYTVKLNIRDISGCEDSITKTAYVKIRSPKAAFDVIDSSGICIPLQTSFTFKGADYESFSWDFGDGGTSTLKDPRHFYNNGGSYTAKLFLTGPGGCVDSASASVTVYNPQATIIINDNSVACNSITTTSTFNPPPGFKFNFYFGDGQLDSSQQTSLTHTYSSPGTYHQYIIFTDKSGCQGVSSESIVTVLGTIPLFGKDKKEFCDNGIVSFSNFTISNENIISSIWNFGDGNTSTQKDPTHNFTTPGIYFISLNTITESQCASTFRDTIRVYRTPVIDIAARDTICLNIVEPFAGIIAQADTALSWHWNFANGSEAGQQDASASYKTSGNYLIQLISSNKIGCADTALHPIYVAPLPTATPAVNPITIISGASAPLAMSYAGAISSYNWSPTVSLNCANCPDPIATPRFTTNYIVHLQDRYGCSNNGSVTVRVVCDDENFFIPNTFSPNGDGSNDRFYPRGKGLYSIKTLRIFNRWGEMVFEKKDFTVNDPGQGWDGTYKGRKAPADVYVYQAEIFCNNGELLKLSGNIALIL